jgi:FkbM family methyltransferase
MRVVAWIREVAPEPVYRAYRRIRVRHLISSYESRHVVHNFGGTTLRLLLADPLAEGWYDHDWPEPPEIAFVRQRALHSGARVFDLGAHHGIYALMLAALVGPDGHVLAVEALPHNASIAGANLRLNPELGERVTIVNAAVAASPGVARVAFELNSRILARGRLGVQEVPATTIDDLSARFGPPALVYVDIEGMEQEALKGARTTLTSVRPWWVVEVHAGAGLEDLGGSAESLIPTFAELDYLLYVGREDSTSGFAPLEPKSTILRSRFFLVAEPRS